MKGRDLRGAYPADRAAALSGVPLSTIHYWARHKVLVPSISPERVKLWSYPDLMGLRTIYWLRQTKKINDGASVPATSMPAVRRAVAALKDLDLELWTEEHGPSVAVSRSGEVFFNVPGYLGNALGQRALDADLLDLSVGAPSREPPTRRSVGLVGEGRAEAQHNSGSLRRREADRRGAGAEPARMIGGCAVCLPKTLPNIGHRSQFPL